MTIAMAAATLLIGGCGGKPDTGVAPPAPAAYEGFLDEPTPSSHVIHGWVWDANRPDDAVEVELLDGDTPLGKVKADLLRQDLQKAEKGGGRHGFEFRVPESLMDGKEHRIQATVASTSQALTNSPRTMRWTK